MRNILSFGGIGFGLLIMLLPFGATSVIIGALIIISAAFYSIMGRDDTTASIRRSFLAVFFIILAAASVATLLLTDTSNLRQDIASQFLFQGYGIAVGAGVALVATILFIILAIHISATYILALHESEGVTLKDGFLLVLSLINGTGYDWIVVADGKIVKHKKGRGFMKKLGGPGKVIIQPGNAVVFERAGRISRIAGASVVLTKRAENIRKIVNLQKQFHMETFDAVTQDKITVKVEVAVVYQILPANQTPGGRIITDTTDLYPVTEETLKRAVFAGTAGGWEGFCQGAPMGVIRDQIMARNVDELFGSKSNPNTKPSTADERVIKEIEKIALEQASDHAPDNGAKILMVDIRNIKLPKSVHDQVAKERRLIADRNTARDLEQTRKDAKKDLIRDVLHAIKDYTGNAPLTPQHVEMATQLINAAANIKPDDVYGREHLQMMEKMAKSDGTKVISTGKPGPIESPISLGNE